MTSTDSSWYNSHSLEQEKAEYQSADRPVTDALLYLCNSK